jgi:hypothetical protein
MRKFKKFNVKKLYRDWLTDPTLYKESVCDWSLSKRAAFFAAHQKEAWELQDLATLYYLYGERFPIGGFFIYFQIYKLFADQLRIYLSDNDMWKACGES